MKLLVMALWQSSRMRIPPSAFTEKQQRPRLHCSATTAVLNQDER